MAILQYKNLSVSVIFFMIIGVTSTMAQSSKFMIGYCEFFHNNLLMSLASRSEAEQVGRSFRVDKQLENVGLEFGIKNSKGFGTPFSSVKAITIEKKSNNEYLIFVSFTKKYLDSYSDSRVAEALVDWELGYASKDCTDKVIEFLEDSTIPLVVK